MSANPPPAGRGTPTEALFRGVADLRGQEHPTSAPAQGNSSFFKVLGLVLDSLRAERSGDRIPVATRFSASVQTDPEANPALPLGIFARG